MGQLLVAWKSEATAESAPDVLSGIARLDPAGTQRDDPRRGRGSAVLGVLDAASFITGVALDVDGGSRLNVIPRSRHVRRGDSPALCEHSGLSEMSSGRR